MVNVTDSTFFDDVIGAMPLPAAMIGADERIVATNTSFDRVIGTGYVGRHFITALRQPATIDAIEQVFAEVGQAQAALLLRVAGRDVTYDVQVAKAGSAVLISLIDRTEAEQHEKMRTDFIANVSHELRTPLTALIGFIETLRGAARNDPAAQDRFLGIMDREAGRMTRLVDELMALSRLEGAHRLRPTDTVLLGDVLQLVLNTLAPLADQAKVTVTLNMPDVPVSVLGDAAQLQQVFTNLIENALKYAGDGKEVIVTLSAHCMQPRLRTMGCTVTVQDFGQGIAPHHIARLTERFYRVDSHRSREVGGTGLGLAIVKHILNRHRGRLKFESTLRQGTTAIVTLPQK